MIIKDLLNLIPDPIARELAIKNTNEDILNSSADSNLVSRALNHAFAWSRSPEGFSYWYGIETGLKDLESPYWRVTKERINKP